VQRDDGDRIFSDHASGKDAKRPQLEAALTFVRAIPSSVTAWTGRRATSTTFARIVLTLTKLGVKVQFIKESLTFTGDDSAMSNLLLSVMGAFAEFERSLIKERQREGIAIAKAKGNVYRGRVPSLTAEKATALLNRIAAGESKAALSREFGISRASGYNYLAASVRA
jgi:DNA invertase Pin-like site-specific DNA recombinase